MSSPNTRFLRRISGGHLVAALIPLGLGIFLFFNRGALRGGAPPSAALFVWERGAILSAVLITALGLLLLEAMLAATGGQTLARPSCRWLPKRCICRW